MLRGNVNNYCVTCGIDLETNDKRRKYCKEHYAGLQRPCLDCGKMISRNSVHCRSCATKAQWESGRMDGIHDPPEVRKKHSEATKAAWVRGCYDGVFQSPTTIEIETAVALDIMGIEHVGQYRPDGCSYIYMTNLFHPDS